MEVKKWPRKNKLQLIKASKSAASRTDPSPRSGRQN
jgi:predicted GIY-YIG superfamily endonuclease